jgi:hypothetical protein
MKKPVLCVAIVLLFLHPASCQEDVKYQNDLITLNMLISIGLNLGLGLGIGSFVQGDWLGGVLQLTGEIVGLSIAFSCVIQTAMPREPGEEIPAWVDPLGNAAVLLVVGARCLWGILRPIRFADLKRSRLMNKEVTFDIAPSITPSASRRRIGIEIGFTLRYAHE